MVYIVNDGRKVVSCRCGDNYLTSAGFDMSACFCLGCIETCTFKNNVYLKLSPGKVLSVCFFVNCNGLSINRDGILTIRYAVRIFVLAGSCAACDDGALPGI